MLEESRRILAQLDIRIPAQSRRIWQMSGAQREAVAIARAVYWNAQLMIMHHLQDVLDVADRIGVMRRGRLVGERKASETDSSDLIGLILGAERFEAA